MTQSLLGAQRPFGNSNWTSPSNVKPHLRQIALEGPFSGAGNACTDARAVARPRRLEREPRALALATPRPWKPGSTDQPIS